MGLALRDVPHRQGGVGEALAYLRENGAMNARRAA
jgi:hypothetical protein